MVDAQPLSKRRRPREDEDAMAFRRLLQLTMLGFLAAATCLAAPDAPPPLRLHAHGAPLPVTSVDAAHLPRADAARPESTRVAVSPAPGAIGRALASAPAGAHLVVAAGEYAEEDLRLARDGVVLEGAGAGKTVVRPASAEAKCGLRVAASHVSVRGLSLEGFRDCGIAIGVNERSFSDVALRDVAIAMPAGNDGIAVYASPPEGAAAVEGLAIERATIDGADQGITVAKGPVRHVAIREVAIRARAHEADSGLDGVGIEAGDDILLDGVEVAGAAGDGIDAKATRVAVVNAYVHGCLCNGVKLWHGGEVVGALVHDCGADASIVLDGAGRYRVAATTVAFHNRRAGGAAAYALTCGYDRPKEAIALELADDLFYRNAGGIALSAGTRATIRGTLFSGLRGEASVVDFGCDGDRHATIAAAQGAAALARAGEASGNLAFDLDPRLAEPEAASLEAFRPARASPLAGAGAPLSPAPKIDLLGQKRSAKAPAVGALERVEK
jgi:hypothetical protein